MKLLKFNLIPDAKYSYLFKPVGLITPLLPMKLSQEPNIFTGGTATVQGDAVLGRSPNATATVNVTGPNATFSTGGDITVGFNGPGILTVNNGLVQSNGSIWIP